MTNSRSTSGAAGPLKPFSTACSYSATARLFCVGCIGCSWMEAMHSKRLLIRARGLYDDPATGLAAVAPQAWRGGFASGAEWMRLVLEQLRHQPVTPVNVRFQRLGLIKYGLSLTGLAACAVIAWIANVWPIALLGLPVFYAIEVQFVFLF